MKMIIVSGSMGSGKTAVVGEMSDLLAARDIPHAAIDLDWLKNGHLPNGARSTDLLSRNLVAVCANYIELGITRFLLAGAVDAEAFAKCRAALPGFDFLVVRLRAAVKTMQDRVRTRETGIGQSEYVARVVQLEKELDGSPVESVSIMNEDRAITGVAHEILTRAGWLSANL